ncbi:MAG: tetratricopeptide repeat protein [Sedimentisphaerales bacterium]|nr:tetratricopeptide repeat protein [Sedimentisphaerales bacterium]
MKRLSIVTLLVQVILMFSLLQTVLTNVCAQSFDPKINANAYLNAGVADYNAGRFESALQNFENARVLYHDAGLVVNEAHALHNLGAVYLQFGLIQKTITAFEQSLALYRQAGQLEYELKTLNQLGLVYSRAGQYLKALDVLEDVLAHTRALQQRNNEGRIQNNIGTVYLNQGWYQQALERFAEALNIASDPLVNDREGEGFAHLNTGTVYRNLALSHYRQSQYPEAVADYQTALAAYQQALTLRQVLANLSDQSVVLLNIGRTQRELGDTAKAQGNADSSQAYYLQALQAFQSALLLYRSSNDHNGEATAQVEIGETHRRLENYPEALSILQAAYIQFQATGNLEGQLQVLEQLSTVCGALGNPLQQAAYLTEMGDLYTQQGRYDQSTNVLWNAIDIQSMGGDNVGLARSLMLIGEAFSAQKNFQDAISFLTEALSLWQQAEHQANEARTLQDLGAAHLKLGMCVNAMDLLTSARTIQQMLGDRRNEGQIATYLGEAELCQGQTDLALSTLQQALAIHREVGNRSSEGFTLIDLGVILAYQQHLPEALEAYQQALTIFRTDGQLAGQGMALTRIGQLYQTQQQDQEALSHYRQAVEVYHELADQAAELEILTQIWAIQNSQADNAGIAVTQIKLGEVYLEQGNTEQAMLMLQQALTIYTTLSDQLGEARAWMLIGVVQNEQDDYAEAVNSLNTALTRYRALQHRSGEAESLVALGDVYHSQSLYNEAETVFLQALDIFRAISDRNGEGLTMMKLGNVYSKQAQIAPADQAETLWQKAIETQQLAIAILSEVDDRYNQLLAMLSLGETYDSAKLYWDALEAYKRALGIMHDTGMFLYSDVFYPSPPILQVVTLTPSDLPVHPADIYRNIAADYEKIGDHEAAAEATQQAEHLDELRQGIEETQQESTQSETTQQRETEQEQQTPDISIEPEEGTESEGISSPAKQVVVRWEDEDTENSEPSVEEEPDPEQKVDNYEDGIEKLQQELTEAREADRPLPEQAAIQQNLADWSLRWGKDDEAQRILDDLLRLFQDINAPQQHAEVLNSLGLIDLRHGRTSEATQRFIAAQTLQENIGDEAGKAKTLNNHALSYYMVGQYDKARDFFEQALDMMHMYQEYIEEATVLNHLALVAYRQARQQDVEGQYDMAQQLYTESVQYLERARTLLQDHPHRPTEGTIINNLGLVYSGQGQNALLQQHKNDAQTYFTQAVHAYEEALIIIRSEGGKAGEGATLHNIGELYARLNQDEKALDALQQALTIEREVGNPIDEARTLSNIGYIYEQQGNSAQALDFYLHALDVQEHLRTAATLEEFKISLAAQASDVYQRAFLLAQQAGDTEQAFELSERARARAFLDMMGNTRLNIRQGVDPDLLSQEQQLRQELTDLYAQMRTEQSKPLFEANANVIDGLKFRITETQQAYETLLVSIKANAPEYAALISVNPVALKDLQSELRADVTLLSYVVTPEKTTIFVITRASVATVDVVVAEQALFDAVVQARRQPAALDALLPESLKHLYAWLIEPVRAELQTPMIGVIPDGVLHYAPFAAFQRPDSDAVPEQIAYFCDEFLLFALPSASVLQFIHPKQFAEDEVNTLALAYKGYEPPLQYAEQEAQGLADIYSNIRLLIGEEATENVFALIAGDFSRLHISAHALLNAVSPFFSGILLYDRMLEVHEIYGLRLQHSDLTVLSACNTNIDDNFGTPHTGREIVALNRAFLYAGAASVVASLWSVDDEATYDFMLAFHRVLNSGLSKAEALQLAGRETRRKYPHPHYWAAFVLTGDPGEHRERSLVTEPQIPGLIEATPTATPTIAPVKPTPIDAHSTPPSSTQAVSTPDSNRAMIVWMVVLVLVTGIAVGVLVWVVKGKR